MSSPLLARATASAGYDELDRWINRLILFYLHSAFKLDKAFVTAENLANSASFFNHCERRTWEFIEGAAESLILELSNIDGWHNLPVQFISI